MGARTRQLARALGQVWTPAWVAEAMVSYALAEGSTHLFDPAVGAGAFFVAARRRSRECRLLGTEIDPAALMIARANGLTERDLAGVDVRDFLQHPPSGPFTAIVANPPYIRHHAMTPEMKAAGRRLSVQLLRQPLDGRVGLHIYFFLRSLTLLADGGRLAYLLPADAFEGLGAGPLWAWAAQHYRIDAVITFTPDATPFPSVDTNAIICLLRRAAPTPDFWWARCTRPTDALIRWTASDFQIAPEHDLTIHRRSVAEGLRTGLSRPPRALPLTGPVLGDYATVVRGIATGANEFFFLTRRQASAANLPEMFLARAVGRTRDVPADVIDEHLLTTLDAAGRPTLLFRPDGRPLSAFPDPVRRYLEAGERAGLPRRPLLSIRRPWYAMETRTPPPPFLFAYLGRRRARFVRNLAGVVPLTSFLCVYPRSSDPADHDRLWGVLCHPTTLSNMSLVGKSYGSGCIKIEPRALERLPLPAV